MTLALGTLAMALPWVLATLVPSMDLPAHMALVEAMHHLGGDGAIAEKFQWGVFPAPNSLFYLIGYPLSLLLGTDLAGRLLIVVVMALMALGYLLALTAFGRSRWFVFLMLPLLGQWVLTEGFVDYYAGMALVLIAVAAQQATVSGRRRVHPGVLCALGGLVFLAHIQAFMALAIVSATLALLQHLHRAPGTGGLESGRAHWRVPLQLLLPGGVLGVLWLIQARPAMQAAAGAVPMLWTGPGARLHELFDHSLLILDGSNSGWVVVVLALSLGLIRLLGRATSSQDARGDASTIDVTFPGAVILLCIVLIMTLPVNVGHYWNLHIRFATLLWPFVVIALLPRHPPRLSLPVIATHALLLTIPAALAVYGWHRSVRHWDRVVEHLPEVLTQAGDGTALVFVADGVPRTGFRSVLWRHLGQYHTIWNHGVTPFSFAYHPGRVVAERDPSLGPQVLSPNDTAGHEAAGRHTHVLQLGEPALEDVHDALSVVARTGLWTLYDTGDTCEGQSL